MRELWDKEVRTLKKHTNLKSFIYVHILVVIRIIFLQIETLTQRRKKVEEYEKIIHNLMFETINKHSIFQKEQNEKLQVCTNVKIQLSTVL